MNHKELIKEDFELIPCADCCGRGETLSNRLNPYVHGGRDYYYTEPCTSCNGTGKIPLYKAKLITMKDINRSFSK